ncbi:MAG TPA: tRNA lysidine(34) synthetase TilS [Bacteroidota bacterium]|nr:tRNA lysidine(34) synthetase TilS [Bacteroidota bacterium]
MVSPNTFSARFREFSRTNGLFGEKDTILVAVSGGVDSMVLLDLLVKEQGLSVIAGHFNHGLRGAESDGDERFVAQRARMYGIPFHAGRGDTGGEAAKRGVGIQEAARDLRYDFLLRLRATTGAARIATAHHADDNAETILLHLFRGTGVQGMTGIPVARDGIIRPLLFAHREEIEEYSRIEKIPFRTDSSNAKDGYTRNAVRHHVLPLLKELVSPSVVDNINRSGDNFRTLAAYLQEETTTVLAECTTSRSAGTLRLSAAGLLARPLLLRQLAVLAAIEEVSGARPASDRVSAVLGLLEKESGTLVTVPGGTEAARERDEIVIRPRDETAGFSITVDAGRVFTTRGFRFASQLVEARGEPAGRQTEYADAERTGVQGLTLRSWREGDWFTPLGMSGRKKLSDFFVDEKVPVDRKNRIPILCTPGGDVIWVCGMRLDDRFKITPATRRVLKLEYSSPSAG